MQTQQQCKTRTTKPYQTRILPPFKRRRAQIAIGYPLQKSVHAHILRPDGNGNLQKHAARRARVRFLSPSRHYGGFIFKGPSGRWQTHGPDVRIESDGLVELQDSDVILVCRRLEFFVFFYRGNGEVPIAGLVGP